jgi:hypothetical protein
MGYGTAGEPVPTNKKLMEGMQKEPHFLYKTEYTWGMKNYSGQ